MAPTGKKRAATEPLAHARGKQHRQKLSTRANARKRLFQSLYPNEEEYPEDSVYELCHATLCEVLLPVAKYKAYFRAVSDEEEQRRKQWKESVAAFEQRLKDRDTAATGARRGRRREQTPKL